MIGPIGWIKGYRMHKRIDRFRRAMTAAGELEAVKGKSDSQILEELLEMVRKAETDLVREGKAPASWRELEAGTVKLLESATFAAESRAAGAA